MYGKIYQLPQNFIFFKPYTPILLNKIRMRIIADHNAKMIHKKRLNDYVLNNTPVKIIYEWSSTTSSTSSDTTPSSVDSSWVDMKKLL